MHQCSTTFLSDSNKLNFGDRTWGQNGSKDRCLYMLGIPMDGSRAWNSLTNIESKGFIRNIVARDGCSGPKEIPNNSSYHGWPRLDLSWVEKMYSGVAGYQEHYRSM